MLPIYEIHDAILDVLRQNNRLVITAPTGSGKTTQLPQMLLKSGLFTGQIIVLQPRRMAARLVAQRVAHELASPLGQIVGYQTRHDSRTSAATRVRFMTEGIFLRLAQSDPTLRGVSAVVLDEFHERSLAADTALALTKSAQERSRPDLRLVVMSATLETEKVREFLACKSLEAGGRLFPIEFRYLDKAGNTPAWDMAADALESLLNDPAPPNSQADPTKGDVLIFMPGAYEIRRTIEACRRVRSPDRLTICPLYSELPAAQQDEALAPAPEGTRKIIVSTNVAQTSITIEGVRHVIDSGLARINRFDPRRGINVLLIEPISQASAQQRAGRAGRLAPGTCTRLWPQAHHRTRPQHDSPEVQRLDLAEVVLQLKAMNFVDVAAFAWLEPPAPLRLQQAIDTLLMLGAIDAKGALMPLGRTMAEFPMHPRLSRLLLEAARRKCLPRAALWAGLISQRDILARNGPPAGKPGARPGPNTGAPTSRSKLIDDMPEGPRSDFILLERAFDAARRVDFDPNRCLAMGVVGPACRELEKTVDLYLSAAEDAGITPRRRVENAMSLPLTGGDLEPIVECLLLAFPDHLAVRKNPANLAVAVIGNRKGTLDSESVAMRPGVVIALEVRELGAGGAGGVKTVLSMATEVEPAWLERAFPDRLKKVFATAWDEERLTAIRVERVTFDDLVVDESHRGDADPDEAAALLADKLIHGELKLEQWDESVEQWITRTRCLGQWFPERKLITYDEDERRLVLEELCAGAVRYSQIKDRPVLPVVKGVMSYDDQQFVEKMAPDRLQLPRGWKMKIEYTLTAPPRGRAKIQDFYGLEKTPVIAQGRTKLILELLGPNYRPLQATDDLASFWANLYPKLKQELARKYPRHEWR